jgi:hypothetical protein
MGKKFFLLIIDNDKVQKIIFEKFLQLFYFFSLKPAFKFAKVLLLTHLSQKIYIRHFYYCARTSFKRIVVIFIRCFSRRQGVKMADAPMFIN